MPDFLKTLLLLQFLFDHCEIYTGETRHIVPPYNKAGISKFLLGIPEIAENIAEIPDFLKMLLLLQFLFDGGVAFSRNLATPPSVLIRSF